jgi:DNA-binding XRE family transcriptional regulator
MSERIQKSPNWGGDRRSAIAKAKHINHIGNPLWEYRVMRGLTQRDLAEEMYISQQCISDMERGRLPLSKYVREWLRQKGVCA